MPRWEILVKVLQSEDDGVDWEKLGIKKPKSGKELFRRRLINTEDVIYVGEYSETETLLKVTWFEDALIVKGSYDFITQSLFECETFYELEDEGREEDLEL